MPKAGETWRHYKGRSCLILGILSNGNPAFPRAPIVALELIHSSSNYNNETHFLESTRIGTTRFYRFLDDFMGEVDCGYKFTKVIDDDEIWGQMVDFDLDGTSTIEM